MTRTSSTAIFRKRTECYPGSGSGGKGGLPVCRTYRGASATRVGFAGLDTAFLAVCVVFFGGVFALAGALPLLRAATA